MREPLRVESTHVGFDATTVENSSAGALGTGMKAATFVRCGRGSPNCRDVRGLPGAGRTDRPQRGQQIHDLAKGLRRRFARDPQLEPLTHYGCIAEAVADALEPQSDTPEDGHVRRECATR